MTHTIEKQRTLLRSGWRALLIFSLVAIGGISIITALELEGYISSSKPLSWESVLFATVVIVTLLAYPFFNRFRLYCALKAVKDADDLEEIEMQCANVRFIIWGSGTKYTTYLIGAVFTDDQGQKYTYIFEEKLLKSRETCAPYRDKKGCTIRLFCYRGTHLVGKIR